MKHVVRIKPNSVIIIQRSGKSSVKEYEIARVHKNKTNPNDDHISVEFIFIFQILLNIKNEHKNKIYSDKRYKSIIRNDESVWDYAAYKHI